MDPAISGASPAVASVEVASVRPANVFVQGLASGIAISLVLAHAWFAVEMRSMREMYLDLGGPPLPALTRLTLTPAWLYGVPALALIAIGFLVGKRPRSLGWYIAVVAVLIVTAVGTYWFAQAPIRDLAGNIRAD